MTVAGTRALAGSSYAADGTIRIVAPASAFGVGGGGTLSSFLVRVRLEAGPLGALTPDNMPDSTARTGSYTLAGATCAPPQPNLTLAASDIVVSGLQGQGHQQVIAAVVHDTGTADAARVPVRIAVDGQQVGSLQYAGDVVAGGSARVSVVWDTRGANGPHTIAVTADPADAIAESDEGDNAASRAVTVQGSRVTG